MAVQFKLTIKQGQRAPDVTIGAGTAIAGSDAMELNVDWSTMTRAQGYEMLMHLARKVQKEMAWPPV